MLSLRDLALRSRQKRSALSIERRRLSIDFVYKGDDEIIRIINVLVDDGKVAECEPETHISAENQNNASASVSERSRGTLAHDHTMVRGDNFSIKLEA